MASEELGSWWKRLHSYSYSYAHFKGKTRLFLLGICSTSVRCYLVRSLALSLCWSPIWMTSVLRSGKKMVILYTVLGGLDISLSNNFSCEAVRFAGESWIWHDSNKLSWNLSLKMNREERLNFKSSWRQHEISTMLQGHKATIPALTYRDNEQRSLLIF